MKMNKKPAAVQGVGRIKPRYNRSEEFWCFVMIALPIIGFLALQVYPILWTFKWSFFSYSGVESQARFIGLENFKTLFTTDLRYWKVWGNTLLFAALKIPIEMVLAMALALMLNKKLKLSGMYQAVFYLPNVISVAIIGLILSNMFSYNGIINGMLRKVGLIGANVDWFANKGSAIGMIIAGSIWNSFGINVMYLLSALTNVPEELYESAELDGAEGLRRFFSITLPLIAPIFQVILLLSILGTLSMNEYIIVLTNGGPSGQTHTVMSYMYTKFVPGFADTTTLQLGYGCAMSLLTTIIFVIVSLGYNKFSNKMKSLY